MSGSPRRPLLGSTLVLGLVVAAAFLTSAASQTATSPSTSSGTTTHSTLGSSYTATTGPTGPTTSDTDTAHATLQEGFETSSGPYHVASSNASVYFSNARAAAGQRSLAIDCSGPCFADLWFDLEGWLTYDAQVQFLGETSGYITIEAHNHASYNEVGNSSGWGHAYAYIARCTETVHFVWRGAAGIVYLDQVQIERSTTTQQPTPSGQSGCGDGPTTTTHGCAPYTTDGYTVYPTCPPPVTTTTGSCYYDGYQTTCTPLPYCNYPTTRTMSTCMPSPSPTVAEDCWNEEGALVPCPSGTTVTVTKTVAVPGLAGWASIGVFLGAAALALLRRRPA